MALISVGVGSAAPRQPQQLNCNGLGVVTVVTAPAKGAQDDFAVAQVVGDGHLIPTAFDYAAFDVTANQQLFSQTVAKGNGNGNHNQQTTACSFTQTGQLSDFLDPGETPPPGTQPTDSVTVTFTATAVVK